MSLKNWVNVITARDIETGSIDLSAPRKSVVQVNCKMTSRGFVLDKDGSHGGVHRRTQLWALFLDVVD